MSQFLEMELQDEWERQRAEERKKPRDIRAELRALRDRYADLDAYVAAAPTLHEFHQRAVDFTKELEDAPGYDLMLKLASHSFLENKIPVFCKPEEIQFPKVQGGVIASSTPYRYPDGTVSAARLMVARSFEPWLPEGSMGWTRVVLSYDATHTIRWDSGDHICNSKIISWADFVALQDERSGFKPPREG